MKSGLIGLTGCPVAIRQAAPTNAPTNSVTELGLQIGRLNRDVAADLVLTRLGAKRSAWNTADIRGEAERLVASVGVVAERPLRRLFRRKRLEFRLCSGR